MLAIWKIKRYSGSAAYITRINQSVDPFGNMGGAYNVHTYDDQYRLTRAVQSSTQLGGYDYSMSYSPSGLAATKNCQEINTSITYGYQYSSNNRISSFAPHRIATVFPTNTEEIALTIWNANGELTSMVQPFQDNFRRHLWNEAGQLIASIDNASCGYYGYDGNGNRAYKLTGQSVQDQHNAGAWQYHMEFNDAVLYVNPYFVVTPKGYTKHYYNGSQRIASRIGRISDLPTNIIDTSAVALESIANAQAYMASVLGTANELTINTGTIADIDGDELDELQWQCLDTNVIVFHITLHNDTNMLLPVLSKKAQQGTNVNGRYYYHADHLGSANWITNDAGTPIEYIHYMPYGELWYNWQASSYNERFKFTGKERDTETGYDYFGARYYLSLLGIWLSPDPLANKYPSISPYAYCGWNPLRYVDPNGKEICIVGEDGVSTTYLKDMHYTGNDAFTKESIDKLNVINNITAGTGFMETLIESPLDFSISMADSKIDGTLSTTSISDTEKQISAGRNASIEDLGHELFHTYQYANGQGGMSIYNEVEAYLFQAKLGYVLNNGSGRSMLETVINTSTNAAYTDAVNTLLFGQQYDKQSFNVVVSSFLQHSRANVSGVYNKYSLQQPTQKRSLIQPFYPIYP